MRLWSLHPMYLDARGLVALWREALLARAVLRGQTRGYTRHPQIERFKAHPHPRLAINAYLAAVYVEAGARGYAFDRSKIGPVRTIPLIPVTSGQLRCEWLHLEQKLAARNPVVLAQLSGVTTPLCHPLFHRVPGPVEPWERSPGSA
jgi:Pyrimidine dimer DNA glycosylase